MARKTKAQLAEEKEAELARSAAPDPAELEQQALIEQFAAEQAAEAEAEGLVPIGIPENRHFNRLTYSRAGGAEPQYHYDGSGGYSVLHPTKGWRVYTAARLGRINGVDKLREGWANITRAISRRLPARPSRIGVYAPYGANARTAQPLVREIIPAEPPLAQGGFVSRQVRRAAERAKAKALAHG